MAAASASSKRTPRFLGRTESNRNLAWGPAQRHGDVLVRRLSVMARGAGESPVASRCRPSRGPALVVMRPSSQLDETAPYRRYPNRTASRSLPDCVLQIVSCRSPPSRRLWGRWLSPRRSSRSGVCACCASQLCAHTDRLSNLTEGWVLNRGVTARHELPPAAVVRRHRLEPSLASMSDNLQRHLLVLMQARVVCRQVCSFCRDYLGTLGRSRFAAPQTG